MRLPTIGLALAGLVALGCGREAETADAADPNPVEGAWRTVEVTTTGPNASTNSSPQPGLRLFVDGHYSFMAVAGTAPRPVLPADAPVSDLAANLEAMTAQAGTYGVAGDMLATRPSVAKNPSVMAAGSLTNVQFSVSGDTLSTVQVSNAAGPIANPMSHKFVRVGSSSGRSPLDGAWRILALTTTGPEGTTNTAPEPGLRLYVGGHYTILQLTRTRGPQPDSASTDEQAVEVWSALTANGGTYRISGDTVRSHAFVAMSPAVMAPDRPEVVRTWRIQGDTLWLTQVANGDVPVENPTTETYVRAR